MARRVSFKAGGSADSRRTAVAEGGADSERSTGLETGTLEIPPWQAPAEWRLRLLYRGSERIRVLRRGEALSIGSGDLADLTIEDPTVSTVHCHVAAVETGLQLRDAGSKNGVFVGSGRVTEATLTGDGAAFCLGETTVIGEQKWREVTGDDLGILGQSPQVVLLREEIRRYAKLSAPVLVLGESGSGKDLVARALHDCSGRGGMYVPLNAAALPESLLDAELFGHVRGAFTGAESHRAGAFETASGGTLFLDEIAELSMLGQSKLLRVVEDGLVRAVGASHAENVDTRIVAATCAPLPERIEERRFRHDLYHRLATLVIDVPPLRQRASDIPLLAKAYLARIEKDVGRKRLAPEAEEILKRARWPGNVRELFAVVYRAAVLSPTETIGPGLLAVEPSSPRRASRLAAERAVALLDVHGTVSAAARAAGVPRSTFRSALDRARSGQHQGDGRGSS